MGEDQIEVREKDFTDFLDLIAPDIDYIYIVRNGNTNKVVWVTDNKQGALAKMLYAEYKNYYVQEICIPSQPNLPPICTAFYKRTIDKISFDKNLIAEYLIKKQ